jgi:hypothetical protein
VCVLDCKAEAADPCSLLPAVGAQIEDVCLHPTIATDNLTLSSLAFTVQVYVFTTGVICQTNMVP